MNETRSASAIDFHSPAFARLCEWLVAHAGDLAEADSWPDEQFQQLADAGVLGWVMPPEYGGADVSSETLTAGYERLARCCLTTTFVLTQRNGACQRIAGSENSELKSRLLPSLCTGEKFATVGVSHLTTSRQHLDRPAVLAVETEAGWTLDGAAPWVTGAARADYIVTGGTCDNGRQILAAVDAKTSGVAMGDPPQLLALNASQTGSVSLNGVHVPAEMLIAGPVEGVMKQGKGGGAGSVTTSALAVGLAGAALRGLSEEAENRPDLLEVLEPLESERDRLLSALTQSASGDAPGEAPFNLSAESIRQRANSLVLRSSQAYLTASKGAGFVQGHPAERLVREAMFFLVWSCPQPVLTATLREFACALD